MVVFIGDSTFKTPMPANVTYARGCTDYIKSFATDRMHVQHVKEIVRKKPMHS